MTYANQSAAEVSFMIQTAISQQAPVKRSSLLASALAHVLFAVLILSMAAPEPAWRVSQFIPLFSPKSDLKRYMSGASRRAVPPRPARPLLISAPVVSPQQLPEPPLPQASVTSKPPHVSADVPLLEAPPEVRTAPPVTTGVFIGGNTLPGAPARPSHQVVQTGTFAAGIAALSPSRAPSSHPQTSGFDASRTAPNPSQPSAAPVAAAGFGGEGIGSRSGAQTEVPTVGSFAQTVVVRRPDPLGSGVSVTGFDRSAVIGAAQSFPQRDLATTPFESVVVKLVPASRAARDGVAERYSPLEILQKPRPAYSAEARRLQLEGEVNLDAVFSSSGRVHVTRVIRGLGHGLDENAVLAATAIQFRPATVNGSPVDVGAVVKITFQLAY